MKKKITLFLLLADGLLLLYWGGSMENPVAGLPICVVGVILMCFCRPFWKGFTSDSLFEGLNCFLMVAALGGFFYGLTFTEMFDEMFSELPSRFILYATALLSLLLVIVIYRFLARIGYYIIYRDVPDRKPIKPISKAPLIAAAFMMFSLLSNMPDQYWWDYFHVSKEQLSFLYFVLTFFPVVVGILFYYLLKYVAGIDRKPKTEHWQDNHDVWPQRFRGTYIGD